MSEKTPVRKPKQARGIQTKEKILDTAYNIFCTKGYYNTNTNEIAREAGVPIGSLYAYFKDKDTIFMEIVTRYHRRFVESNTEMTKNIEICKDDMKAWLVKLMENLIHIHEASKFLNREIQRVSYDKPEIAALLEVQRKDSLKITQDALNLVREDIRVADIEAASIVVFDSMSAIVDRIVFGSYAVSRDRIIAACVEQIYKYLAQ